MDGKARVDSMRGRRHLEHGVQDALTIPLTPFGLVKTRVVSDMHTGRTLETLLTGPTASPEQIHRSLRNLRDVGVLLEVHHHKDKAAKSREEQDMVPGDLKKYSALAARLLPADLRVVLACLLHEGRCPADLEAVSKG